MVAECYVRIFAEEQQVRGIRLLRVRTALTYSVTLTDLKVTRKEKGTILSATLLALGVLVLDLLLPRGVAAGVLYTPVMVLLMRMRRGRFMVPYASLATAFMLGGFFAHPAAYESRVDYMNLALCIMLLWSALFLLRLYISRHAGEAEAARPAARDTGPENTPATEPADQRIGQYLQQLEEANRELEGFSYAVSHDLRAPLRSINGYGRILLEDHASQLDGEGQRILNIVINNARKMGALVDDLLMFSRVGRVKMEKQQISPAAMVHEIARELVEQHPEAKVQLEVRELPDIQADKSLMRQVFFNLLDNAIKYSGGRETIEIEVGGFQRDGMCTIYVKDNGVGFDMAYSNKLFGVFQRLHSGEEYAGTGIGLSLVKRIMDRHQGQVWAEAEEGKGAAFYFALPMGTGE